MKNTRKQNIRLLLFCAPALAVYILFKLYPALSGVFYSLTNWNGLKKNTILSAFPISSKSCLTDTSGIPCGLHSGMLSPSSLFPMWRR